MRLLLLRVLTMNFLIDHSVLALRYTLICLLSLVCGVFLSRVIYIYKSPLCLLRGPSNVHWIFGHIHHVGKVQDPRILDKWTAEYGYNCLTRWLLSIPTLWTVDPRTINHILRHSYDYTKPWEGASHARRLFGPSMIVSEGDIHKKQRRVLNPAFGPAQIRDLTEIFLEKTNALRDYWKEHAIAQGGCLKTDVVEGIGRTTLDIIGIAGFDYRFDALNPTGKPNELNKAFKAMFKTPAPMSFKRVIVDIFPFFSFLDKRARKVEESRAVMRRIGLQLIDDKKAEVTRAATAEASGLEKKAMTGRDLLTLLIKANMAIDIPDSQRLSDEEVLSQVVTFLVAGHETTGVSVTWTLYALTQCPEVQRKLRAELLTVHTASPTMDELSALPYLDAVVRESLRMYPPVALTLRMATRDDVLPVSEPFADRHGTTQTEIRIVNGNRIVIPIAAYNRLKSVWGEDAAVFRPERWESPPEAASSLPGVWAHNLTFLSGARACIAWRFSVVELKAFLFSLVREFEFELAVSAEEIVPAGALVQRPNVRSEREMGAQLPLLLRPYVHT
ncbi:cytochrome P450 [Daedaleopsis nitida]|nr:cytochrome P450 [Daedaleopsis nitida]